MCLRVRVMVFKATFNNISVISWWSVLLVEETGVLRKNHRPGARVSSTNKTDHHDITEILLKVALNTITLTLKHILKCG
jgi:predicted component of type VI protein secretion system